MDLSARRPDATPFQREFPLRDLDLKQPTALISASGIVTRRGCFEVTGFTSKLNDVYFDQALVLPPGAVGTFLGSEQITAQNANGLVFVAVGDQPGAGARQL